MIKKIAIVTTGLEGLTRNNGIGVVSRAMAELLARDGHEVTILFAAVHSDVDKDFHKWQRKLQKKGIKLCSLKEPNLSSRVKFATKLSYAAYEFLSQRHFDIIHFEDVYGYGYYSMLAKKRNLAFASTTLCVTLHGPLFWHFYYNDTQKINTDSMEFYYQEKKSIEWADVCFAPSHYILNWMQQQNWKVPQISVIQKLPMRIPKNLKYKNNKKINEIVFLGRLEKRKGLDIFCKALNKTPQNLSQIKKITFLGRVGEVSNTNAKKYILKMTKNLPFEIKILDNLERAPALKYLCSSQALVVIPSRSETFGLTLFECIHLGIPFLASDIPAFREGIENEFPKNALVPLNVRSWAVKLESYIKATKTLSPVKSKLSVETFWSQWHFSHQPHKYFKLKKGLLTIPRRCLNEYGFVSLPIVSRKRTHLI